MRVLYKTFIFFIAIIVFLKLLLLYLQTKGIYGSVRLEPHPGAVARKAIGDEQSARANASIERGKGEPVIHVSVVICGDHTQQATTMLKSTIVFTKRQVFFHVIAEDSLHEGIENILNPWRTLQGSLQYKLYSLKFPRGEKKEDWKKLFKPCASQRLFLPEVDSILYMDTDTLLLRPVEDLWRHFESFGAKQLASMTPEGEVTESNWYPRFARHPFYGKNGVNSGVMLMNLTRMRTVHWEDKILPIYRKYKFQITWGDQDILNILFHEYPDLLFIITCDWNFRPDHCMYGNNCGDAKKHGISVMHGNRQVFHNDKQPFFKAVFDSMMAFKPGEDVATFVENLSNKLNPLKETYCGAMKEQVLTFPLKYLKQHS